MNLACYEQFTGHWASSIPQNWFTSDADGSAGNLNWRKRVGSLLTTYPDTGADAFERLLNLMFVTAAKRFLMASLCGTSVR
mmetsp:Transcript_33932/g.133138  ORF Transcript_33932/g.133138 Transcript_33932/m.133138 type:complete len:81 (-) Transcript_33932:1842-2084(-)